MKALGKLFRTTAFKLSAAYFVLFGVGAFLVLGGVGSRVESVLDEQIAETVDAEIQRLVELYGEGGLWQIVRSVDRRVRAPGGSIYLVTTYTGDYVVGNIVSSPALSAEEGAMVETTYKRRGEADDRDHPALARLAYLPGGFRLLVGHDVEDHLVLRQILRRGLGASLFWLALVGTLGGLYVAYRMLERVDEMAASARRIMAGELDERLAISGAGDELDRLAANLNAMLARIGQLMRGLGEVSDNIAHDLRTPLTRLRNRAEAAMREGASKEECRAALGAVIDESDDLIRVFDALLMIARAEAGQGCGAMSAIEVDKIVADIVELYEAAAEAQNISLTSSIEAGLGMQGNRELLGQALGNVLDNALKYGATGQSGAVSVIARRVGDRIEIVVADRGQGVPPEDRERALERFVRLDSSRSQPGSGLGLALAAAIARLHQGSLRLEDNAPGLRVVFSLPVTRAPQAAPASSRA